VLAQVHDEHDVLPLVGREHELRAAEGVLERLEQPGLRALAISGELGIGKTRLAHEIARLAEWRGALTLWGRAAGPGAAPPFAPIVDALDPYLATARRPPDSPQALAGLLERIARDRALAMFVDDVQWLDRSSCQLLVELLRRSVSAPVLLVLVCRRGQWPAPLSESLSAARTREALTEVSLLALGDETETLIRDKVDADAVDSIRRVSGGNPFYALELAREWRGDGPEPGATAPSIVRAAIAEDLASLSPPALAILRAGAVLGDPFVPRHASAIAGVSPGDAAGTVFELVQRGLCDALLPMFALGFKRPIVRHAVYEGMGLASRLAAHAQAAEVLSAPGVSLTARARHIEHRGRGAKHEGAGAVADDDVALLIGAAEHVARSNPPAAVRWFGAALGRMRHTDERQVTTLLQRSAASLAAGDMADARKSYDTALEIAPAQLLDDAPSLSRLARVEHFLGVTGSTRVLLRRALEREPDARSTALLRIALAIDCWGAGERAEMTEHARLALACSESVDDQPLRARAASIAALASYVSGSTELAAAQLAQAERVVEALTDGDVAGNLECLLLLGYVSHGLERLAPAAQHFDRGVRLSGRSRHLHLLVLFTLGRALCEFMRGRLPQAEQRCDSALHVASQMDNPQLLLWAQGLRSTIALMRGRRAPANEAAKQAADAANRVESGFLRAVAQCCLGILRLEAGQDQADIEHILRHAGGPDLDRLDAGFRPGCYAELARFERMQGRLGAAHQWLVRAEQSAGALGLRGRKATVERARARLILERDPAEATRLAMDAVDGFFEVDQRMEAARALSVAGRAQALDGDELGGAATIERAIAVLAECGADRHLDAAARELRALGVSVKRRPGRRTASSGIEALSRRERDVADLVTQGLTNHEIAEELFVSPKTVEDHLARAFAKVGVSSRASLAAAVESSRAAARTRSRSTG
jgi:DNA-binding CsgD family transcriptional regulator/tetratricopeptide (TPR) repeat protein